MKLKLSEWDTINGHLFIDDTEENIQIRYQIDDAVDNVDEYDQENPDFELYIPLSPEEGKVVMGMLATR